jgi:tRNA uridine 5-carboxymethylaminomethyl modification enzyme
VLNGRKGPAVRATRGQADRALYKAAIQQAVSTQPNLSLFQQPVDDVCIEGDRIVGVITQAGMVFRAQAVVLTVGTFLNGRIHIGDQQSTGGRAGDPASIRLSDRLHDLGFETGRLKTGTPARIDRRTIDFSQLTEQPGDTPTPYLSYFSAPHSHPKQVSCFITHTNAQTHAIIRAGLSTSAMYSGNITGTGPRYCPSIEDKVTRFAEREAHQVFLEPEGLHSHEIYPNGISTSLSYAVQCDFIRSIKGLSDCHITRPGYAIEYDFFDPRRLKKTLETKAISGLFFAGQINGTTGYEEAAAQGLMAGINAVQQIKARDPVVLGRDEAYIGVLIDDLTTCGTQEPYRMFTSRAEYRLLLRQDNADIRLSEQAYRLGLLPEADYACCLEKQARVKAAQAQLTQGLLHPETPAAEALEAATGDAISKPTHLSDVLSRPSVKYHNLSALPGIDLLDLAPVEAEQVDIQAQYAGYLDRQQAEINRQRENEHKKIPDTLDYETITGLSHEVRQKLQTVRPDTLGQAARIPGVTPASIALLLVSLKKHAA